jgi:hypothetical protein
VRAVPVGLLLHPLARRGVARHPIDAAGEVERLLDAPDLVVVPWGDDARRLPDSMPGGG